MTLGIKLATAILAALALTGCGDVNRRVILQHPTTQQVVECKVDPWGDTRFNKQVDDCAKQYEQAGFTRIGGTN
jgi:hypothetical protein